MKNRIKTQLLGILGVGSFTGMAIADNGGAGSGVISRTGEALQSTVATIANVGGALGGLAADRLLGDVSGSVSFGYDTEYFYRGVELGSDPFWVGADLSIPITEGLSFNPGIWYINPSGGNDLTDEIDYYVSLDWIDRDRIGSVSLKYRNYSFPEAGGSTNEVGLGLGYNLAGISFAATGYYDFDLEAEYYELSAGTTVGLSDRIAISAGGILGIGDDDLNHALLILSLPIAITDRATVEPYIALNYALDQTEDINEDDETVLGGVSISLSF